MSDRVILELILPAPLWSVAAALYAVSQEWGDAQLQPTVSTDVEDDMRVLRILLVGDR